MNFVLKLKHWQVFLIIIFWLILYYILTFATFDIGSLSGAELRAISGVIGVTIMIGWVMIIGLATNQIKGNPYRFANASLIIAAILAIFGYSELHLQSINPESPIVPDSISLILTPLALIGVLITFRTVSKSLKSAEKGEKARFGEYIIDAFLLFVLPIGVWMIQPRLNALYNNLSK